MKSLFRRAIPVLVPLWACGVLCAGAFAASPRVIGPSESNPPDTTTSQVEVTIPGPLRSFLRMAGISQKIPPEQVLPLLGRNVSAQGYEGGSRPTEFLILLVRYVRQARELSALSASDGMLRATNCEDAQPLLHVLGYRARHDCGQNTSGLETADAERAFLTIDSGFPLRELEQTLQGGKPFAYQFGATKVPALFSEREWAEAGTAAKGAVAKNEPQTNEDMIDVLLHDPAVARLYWALAKLDPETRNALWQSVGVKKLTAFSAVMDFYSSRICIRSGHVVVPGGVASEPTWRELVGKHPDNPAEFVPALLTKDKGWLAAYFDVLSRLTQEQQAHLVQPARLRAFYQALRSEEQSAEATKGSFRPAPWLLLLATRLKFDANGDPVVPGNLAVWREILRQKNDSHIVRNVGKHESHVTTPDRLAEAMFAVSRAKTDVGPLQIYLTLSEMDSHRAPGQKMSPETVRLLARKFEEFSSQYRIFSEFPELSDESIALFLDVAGSMDTISNHPLRGNALGTFQANVGIWEILARQGQIPSAQWNDSWQRVVKPFAKIRSAVQLYDAGHNSLGELFRASTGKAKGSQDEIIELLAGPQQNGADAKSMHQELATRIRSVLDSQRLVSLDTLFALGDGLADKAQGKPVGDWLVTLAGELREFEMPRPIFTNSERTEWAAGIYNNSHTDSEMHTDLTKVVKSPATRAQLDEARGQLVSFVRDTLVGLNYAYYEPPGAQALHNNPLFVRSHDFSAETVGGIKAVWQSPQLFGEGSPAGGGAHFVGSLADLPYVLAELEQDFISPENVQALIWRELVPGLLTSAVLPRWWGVSSNELHAVALYQRTGEEILAAGVSNEDLRGKITTILSDRMSPQTVAEVELALRTDRVSDLLPRLMPADSFYLAAEFGRRFPDDAALSGVAGRELRGLNRDHPEQVGWERISQDFGVPHPTLAHTYGRELLNVAPLPAFAGYSSRLLAESWDSGNLYWARLADESGRSPVTLNRLVPQLTRRMVEKVFATDFEDWPALVRAMRETGDDFRHQKIAAAPVSNEAVHQ